jgi:TonB family protein
MKAKLIFVAAAILGGFVSSSAFAAQADTKIVTATIDAAPARVEAPVPLEVVGPTRLAAYLEGRTFDVAMTIDANGRAQNIRILTRHDDDLRRSLVTAMKQWQFKPAMKNGTPITQKVILPVQLI